MSTFPVGLTQLINVAHLPLSQPVKASLSQPEKGFNRSHITILDIVDSCTRKMNQYYHMTSRLGVK